MRRQGLVAVLVMSVGIGMAVRAVASPGRGSGSRVVQGYLGVDVQDLSDEELASLKTKDLHGAEIIRLDHDGPACKAGVREHDVVLQVDGHDIDGREQFRRLIHDAPAGRTVTMVVLREGQQQTIKATMANREEVERQAWEQHIAVVDPDGPPPPPPPADGPGGRVGGSRLGFLHGGASSAAPGAKTHSFLGTMLGAPYTGAVVEPVGPQLGEFFGVPSGVGLLVKSVDGNSPAATAGLHAGDVVLKANQVAMTTESDWTKALHENKGRSMAVLVLREKREQTVTLTPDAKKRSRLEFGRQDTIANQASLVPMDLLRASD